MSFLADDELELLTGYKRRHKQREELAKHGIPFLKRHDGFPVVHTSTFDNKTRIKQHEEKPNLDGL